MGRSRASRRCRPGPHGVYTAHDGVVDVAWETDGSTVTLRPNANGQLAWNGVTYGIVDPLNAGHLSGVFRKSGGSGATVTFKGNGRFDDEGITGDTLLPGTDNPSASASHSIAGNTVTMLYDSGPLDAVAVRAAAVPRHEGSGRARPARRSPGCRRAQKPWCTYVAFMPQDEQPHQAEVGHRDGDALGGRDGVVAP